MRPPKVILFLVLTILLANVFVRGPDLYHFLTTPQGFWFTGQSSWVDHIDLNLYFGAIRWGQLTHQALLPNLADSTSKTLISLYPLYTIVGILTPPAVDPPLVYHSLAVICSAMLIVTLYWLSRQFTPKHTVVSLLLLVFGGGAGWLIPPLLIPDMSQPGFSGFSALRSPHDSLSYALISLLLVFGFQAIRTPPSLKRSLLIAFLLFLELTIHPHLTLLLVLILTLVAVTERSTGDKINVLPLVKIFLPVFGLYYLVFGHTLLNDQTTGLTTQNPVPPNFVGVILGLGLLFPGIIKCTLAKNKSSPLRFLLIWLYVQWGVMYLPLPYHGLLIRGFFVPAVFLGIVGWQKLLESLQNPQKTLVALTLLFFSFGTTLWITSVRFSGAHHPRSIYLTQNEASILKTLRTNYSSPGLLASYRMMNLAVGQTTARPYVGHRPLTRDFSTRIQTTQAFFRGQLPLAKAKQLLLENNLGYIIWGVEERELAQSSVFPYPDLVVPVLESDIATLFAVKP